MPAAVYDITIEQGATGRLPHFRFGTLLVDGDGAPILDADGNQQIDQGRDFTGCTFRLQMRRTQSLNSEVVFTVTSEDTDGGITADANGNITIVVPDTKTHAAERDGYWDLKCYNPDLTEDRLLEGLMIVNPAVTTEATP